MTTSNRAQSFLSKATPAVFSAWAIVAAFGTYFCMYAFRKGFSAGTYSDQVDLFGMGDMTLKILFIIAQVLGYCTSKFMGIKVVSELPPVKRIITIAGLIFAAEVALVLFAIIPTPYNALCMFLNGLPLGMIWGLVFGFLEGRKTSDLLGAGLCASFIVASGFVRYIGKLNLEFVSEYWMPAVTGAMFAVPLAIFLFMLGAIPPPTKADEEARTRRAPMDKPARKAFLRRYGGGITMLVMGYVLLTAFRDFRDNFSRELWDALGYADTPSILATAELPVAFGSLLLVALLVGIRSNPKALKLIHIAMIAGAVLCGVSTLLFQFGLLGPAPWMVLVGLGLYVCYVPVNCVLFDRLIAATESVATAGFLIYVADSFGYLGTVGLLLYKNFGQADLSWLSFFVNCSYATAIVCGVSFLGSMLYFNSKIDDIERQTNS